LGQPFETYWVTLSNFVLSTLAGGLKNSMCGIRIALLGDELLKHPQGELDQPAHAQVNAQGKVMGIEMHGVTVKPFGVSGSSSTQLAPRFH
jgi:hypothetical protein